MVKHLNYYQKNRKENNMPTLTEEIKKVLNIYYWNHNQNPATKDLLSLIQSTVKGCVPEKLAFDNPIKDACVGFNQAIDTITSNLQKAGLI